MTFDLPETARALVVRAKLSGAACNRWRLPGNETFAVVMYDHENDRAIYWKPGNPKVKQCRWHNLARHLPMSHNTAMFVALEKLA